MRITKLLPYLIFLLFVVFSCKNENKKDVKTNDTLNNQQNNFKDENLILNAKFIVDIPEKVKCGDIIKCELKTNQQITPDSIVLFLNNERYSKIENLNKLVDVKTSNLGVGSNELILKVFSDRKNKIYKREFKLLSDIVPERKTYKVVNTFPHDPNAYTQGLCIDNGVLYEATGLETKSSLRKVNLKTGEVQFSILLPNNYFGEGITVFGDKIYQITWRDHTGFVYEKDNFQQVAEFNFSTEGWGLTNNESFIFMSDGTNRIFVLEPNTMSLLKQIEVYDNNGPIYYLNELEYINGVIYANVYTKDYIVTIEPSTGKVLSKIDFANILSSSLKNKNTDVLNGIAYDRSNKKIYVTGKNWPRLFEVKIVNR